MTPKRDETWRSGRRRVDGNDDGDRSIDEGAGRAAARVMKRQRVSVLEREEQEQRRTNGRRRKAKRSRLWMDDVGGLSTPAATRMNPPRSDAA
jgi:hypothetical protein